MPTGQAAENRSFAERLVALLERHGQPRYGAGTYLAARYKVARVTANAWLNGTHKCDIPTAQKIARDHGSTFEALYLGQPEASPNQVRDGDPPPYHAPRPDQRSILDLWDALDAKGRRTVREIATALAERHPTDDSKT